MKIIIFLLTVLICNGFYSIEALAQQVSLPAIKQWQENKGELVLSQQSQIVISSTTNKSLSDAATLLQQDLKFISGLDLPITTTAKAKRGSIILKLEQNSTAKNSEAYALSIDSHVVITAPTSTGIFYGTQTLLQMVKTSADRLTLPKGNGLDAPDYKVRSIMIDLGRRYFEMEYLEFVLRNMAWHKLNTLHLHFTDWLGFRLESDTYPNLASEEAYSKEDIRHLQDLAKKYHITIVPEIDLPAHATFMTDFNPDLAFTCKSMRFAKKWQGDEANAQNKAWTIDITKQKNRDWINALLNEFIPLFDGPYFHIGGDEYQYDPEKYQCPELMAAMKERGYGKPGDIFIEWLNEANELVKSHGKQTKIWNWWRFGANETTLQPAKDIVIDVWNLPRQEQIIKDGYQVVLTPESQLYVSPGLENDEGYGIVDLENIYESWQTVKHDNVLGYKVSIWSDGALDKSDQWFEGKSVEAKAVLAEKIWGSKGSTSVEGLLKRLSMIGNAPIHSK
ncbi:family 20 glycosylhydrolase [Thalassotalea sp. PLHSN55]|uniref:family 20 glycosylhydrolase n=1 Tax=Thalassotalea sp. PLHSN55 TaxID=3435888 RepID=UPI003F85EC11